MASDAIQQASRDGIDVVLVDTAGRTQDNQPLMRALAELVYVNAPDITLLVGEALVGNDAVDRDQSIDQSITVYEHGPHTELQSRAPIRLDCPHGAAPPQRLRILARLVVQAVLPERV